MKILRSILAAFAAIAMMLGAFPSVKISPTNEVQLSSMTSSAYAKGKKGKRIWMAGSSREEIVATFLRGDEPCVGSAKNHTCYNYDPILPALHIQQVSRPEGILKNVVTNRDVVLDGKNVVLLTETGLPMVLFQLASEQQNAAAIWNTALANVPAAAFNGAVAAGVQAAFPACGGNCGGGGATAISISDSAAQSIANTIVQGAAGCTGPCAPASTPTHPRN